MTTAAHHYTNTLPAVLTAPAKLPHWRTTLCRLGDAYRKDRGTDRAWLQSFRTLRSAWFGADKAWRLAWICGCLDIEFPSPPDDARARIPFAEVEAALKRAQRALRDERRMQ